MAEKTELGYLALVLHAHLPYVRHLEEDCLEERWFHEAISETYVPLLRTLENLVEDQVDFRITVSLSPTLLSMFNDELLLTRYRAHLENLIDLAIKETARTRRDPDMNRLSVMYLKTFMDVKKFLEKNDYNLILPFKKLAEKGVLELITTAATHGFMPAMETEESIFSQWKAGLATFEKYFGFLPKGVWLPECGYTPGLDRILKHLGVQYFFCDSHALEHATPKPRRGTFSPLSTGYGVYAFARDRESSSQVWSTHHGYPGDFNYREYYRDIGFDLPLSYIHPYIHPKGIRVNTGIKYYRITSDGDHKEPYRPDWAREKAAEHAGHFMFNRECQIRHIEKQMDQKPIVVAPYDAELFGHWWYEGPLFIDFLCRKIYFDQNVIKMITPSEYLTLYPEQELGHLPLTTWGRNGYNEVWINAKNAWIYRHLHQAEKKMVQIARNYLNPSPLQRKALDLACKQLLLAQSSDWAFIMDNESMVQYAHRRVKEHVDLFNQLYDQIMNNRIDEHFLQKLEQICPIFDKLSFEFYLFGQEHRVAIASSLEKIDTSPRRKVLMLSWEYPPKIVGGLSRAVYDLSRSLVKQGEEVHVFTSQIEEYPDFENVEGVFVHRIPSIASGQIEFVDWVIQFNIAIVHYFDRCKERGLYFDLIHAHDWLVSMAARELKKKSELPMIATIHATEHGRNQGIFTDLQKKIHREEWKLTYDAQKVIVCSQYMQNELIGLFQLPQDKVIVVPNGVDQGEMGRVEKSSFNRHDYALPQEKIIFFVGRLVREKGAQYLIEAVPDILFHCPEAKFIIAGKGPMKEELEGLAQEKGVAHKILFTGFIQDEQRNGLLWNAYAAVFPSVYEPFGIVALEAMASGTPVIVSDIGGLAEIVQHEISGLKTYPGMVSSIRDQIIFALKNENSMKSMASTARQILNQNYQWDDLATKTRLIYDDLIMGQVHS